MQSRNCRLYNFLYAFLLFNSIRLNAQSTLFTLEDPSVTNVLFNNGLNEDTQINALTYQYLYNGGGVAAGDINNDGLCDLFFTGNMVQDKLYLNTGSLHFEDITGAAGITEPEGWSTGVTMADVNADGWLDIYVCRSGPYSTNKRQNLLYVNNHNNTFTESAAQFGLNDSSFSTQAAFFDSDADGDLDMFLLNHAVTQLQGYNTGDMRNRRDPYAGNKLFRNDNGYFTDISAEAGINGSPMTFGLGLVISDFNNDQLPDIYVTNDYQEQDFLYINQGNNQFTEQIEQSFGHTANFSMGCDVADINYDGFMDMMAVDMLPESNERQKKLKGGTRFDAYELATNYGFFYQHMHNMLQLNNGNSTFSEIAWSAGVAATDWSWAPLFADFNLDGFQDIYITNGYRRDYTDMDFLKYVYSAAEQQAFQEKKSLNTLALVQQMPSLSTPNYMFAGNDKLQFEQVTENWGLNIPSFSNGSAYADLDNDGDLELIVNNIDDTAFIFKNNQRETTQAHFVRIIPRSTGKNPFCYGTRVIVKTSKQTITSELYTTRGFQSSVDPVIHVGTGEDSIISLKVIFPPGDTISLTNIPADSTYIIPCNTQLAVKKSNPSQKNSGFTQLPFFLPYTHHEISNPDFKRDPLLMQTISNNGPHMASADINQDGIEDIFFTGAKNQKAQLFLSAEEGYFPLVKNPWSADSSFEDTDAVLFDADGDADIDILVVSGSTENPAGSPLFQDRLYLNAGDGTFTKAANALPVILQNKTCAATIDYDLDGDWDVFIGSGPIPDAYPVTSGCYLYENNAGVFTDVTAKAGAQLLSLGECTDVQRGDINGDGTDELIIAGNWTEVMIVQFTNKKAIIHAIPASAGWWNCINLADMDADGDLDIIAGNRGTNHPVQIDRQHPATMYAYDFDHNGSVDPLVTAGYPDGGTYPIHSLDDLLGQMPSLKKKLFYYSQYAVSTLDSIFPEIQLNTLPHTSAETMYTTLFRNMGNFNFVDEQLPETVQWYPVYAIATRDVDRDGDMDIICGGNNFSVRPEFTRMDAGAGSVLYNNGLGKFEVGESLNIRGEIRDMKCIRFGKSVYLISAVRNDVVHCFELNR